MGPRSSRSWLAPPMSKEVSETTSASRAVERSKNNPLCFRVFSPALRALPRSRRSAPPAPPPPSPAPRPPAMSAEAKPAEEEELVEEKPWVKEPERFVAAHDCLRLRFVGSAAELSDSGDSRSATFTPQYVHQIFDNEAIELPLASRPLNMEVLYTAASLNLWIRCANDAAPQADAAMDALYALMAELPAPCASLDAFTQAAEQPFDPASVCGGLLESYTLAPPAAAATTTTAAATAAATAAMSYAVYCGAVHGDAARKAFALRVQTIYRWYTSRARARVRVRVSPDRP